MVFQHFPMDFVKHQHPHRKSKPQLLRSGSTASSCDSSIRTARWHASAVGGPGSSLGIMEAMKAASRQAEKSRCSMGCIGSPLASRVAPDFFFGFTHQKRYDRNSDSLLQNCPLQFDSPRACQSRVHTINWISRDLATLSIK